MYHIRMLTSISFILEMSSIPLDMEGLPVLRKVWYSPKWSGAIVSPLIQSTQPSKKLKAWGGANNSIFFFNTFLSVLGSDRRTTKSILWLASHILSCSWRRWSWARPSVLTSKWRMMIENILPQNAQNWWKCFRNVVQPTFYLSVKAAVFSCLAFLIAMLFVAMWKLVLQPDLRWMWAVFLLLHQNDLLPSLIATAWQFLCFFLPYLVLSPINIIIISKFNPYSTILCGLRFFGTWPSGWLSSISLKMPLLSSLRSAASGSRSQRSRNNKHLSVIQENSIYVPGMSHRPTSSQFFLEELPNSSFEAPPPAYVFAGAKFNTNTPNPTKPSQKSIISKTGTWRRSAFALLLILCLVGLILGLSIGLTQKGQHNDMYEF